MDFKSLIGLIKKPKSPVEELERALENIDISAAEAKVEALEKQRREMLLTASNEDLAALDVKIRDGNLDVERLSAMQETLTQRIAAAKAQDAEDIRSKAYAAAQRAYSTGKELLAEYEKHAVEIAAIIGKLAELEQVVDAANADLPSGAVALPAVETKLRGLPYEPIRLLNEEVLHTGWFYEGAYMPSGAVPESLLTDAKLTGNRGTVMDYSRSGAGTPIKVRRCKVVQTAVRDAVDALGAYVLSDSVSLPGVFPGANPIWGEEQSHTTAFAWQSYNRLAVIEQAASAAAGSGRPRDPRPEPFTRKDVKIIPLGDDEQAAD